MGLYGRTVSMEMVRLFCHQINPYIRMKFWERPIRKADKIAFTVVHQDGSVELTFIERKAEKEKEKDKEREGTKKSA